MIPHQEAVLQETVGRETNADARPQGTSPLAPPDLPLPPTIGELDLRPVFESWPYDEPTSVRLAQVTPRRAILLVRRPSGIDQYELENRPDGRLIHGCATALAFHSARAEAAEQNPCALAFELTPEDCAELVEEANAYHDRVVLLFRLSQWSHAERDVTQILGLLQLLTQQAQGAVERVQLQSWRPILARLRALARALALLEQGQYRQSFDTARNTLSLPATTDEGAADHRRLAIALLAAVQSLLSQRPALKPHREFTFLRQHDYWILRYDGVTACLKGSRGMDCLVSLLRSPGREFHVSELLANLLDDPAPSNALDTCPARPEGGDRPPLTGLNDGCPLLDVQARAECRSRLLELREDLAEAERCNDSSRALQAQADLNALTEYLASAVGLGGRLRKSSSDAERARSAITKRIRHAIQKVRSAFPMVGDHLEAGIRTGYYCSYQPTSGFLLRWQP
jgi:hypothetical protein